MLASVVFIFATLWVPYRGLLVYNSFATINKQRPFLDLWYLMFAKTWVYMNWEVVYSYVLNNRDRKFAYFPYWTFTILRIRLKRPVIITQLRFIQGVWWRLFFFQALSTGYNTWSMMARLDLFYSKHLSFRDISIKSVEISSKCQNFSSFFSNC